MIGPKGLGDREREREHQRDGKCKRETTDVETEKGGDRDVDGELERGTERHEIERDGESVQ